MPLSCNERVVFPDRAHKLDKSQPENTRVLPYPPWHSSNVLNIKFSTNGSDGL